MKKNKWYKDGEVITETIGKGKNKVQVYYYHFKPKQNNNSPRVTMSFNINELSDLCALTLKANPTLRKKLIKAKKKITNLAPGGEIP